MLTSVVPAASPIARRWERVAILAVVVVLVGLAALHSVNRARSEAAKELVALAAHEALHLDRVVARYRATAGLSGSSAAQADMYEAWRGTGDDGARERLFVRLGQIADAGGFADVVLLDPSLQPLWSATGEGTSVGARVAEVWPAGAPAGAEAVFSFDDAASTVPSLAFAVALRTDTVDPPPVVVFLLPATTVLARDLGGLAIGSPGVRIGLFDAAGDGLRGVAGGGDPPDPVAWALPWSRTDAFAVRLARGGVAQGRAVVGVDERGVAVLAVGAHALVTGATDLAVAWGVPERVIGLTLVAVGTSLPELASSLVAALRRETDIILGNVIGSNLFNLLAVLGTAAVVHPIAVPVTGLRVDLAIMFGFAVVVVPLLLVGRRLGRVDGALLLGAYVAYTVWLFR